MMVLFSKLFYDGGDSKLNIWQSMNPFTASPMTQQVKNPPAMRESQEMMAQYLDWDDLLEKEMATHSSILVWKIPWTEEPGGLQSMGSQRVGHDLVNERTHAHSKLSETEIMSSPPGVS